jgi:NAD(P)-dependent dehydrogenase (short-subunit alcohol dehydrogenase family)
VLQLSKYFAKYFKGTGIRVNSIIPGGIKDKQPELFLENYQAFCANKGMLEKSDLVGALIFLLSEMSTFMTGQNLIIDDGFSL